MDPWNNDNLTLTSRLVCMAEDNKSRFIRTYIKDVCPLMALLVLEHCMDMELDPCCLSMPNLIDYLWDYHTLNSRRVTISHPR